MTSGWMHLLHIGWAESVAVKLAILWVTEQDVLDNEILIHNDNKPGSLMLIKKGLLAIFHPMLPSNALLPASFLPTSPSLRFSYCKGTTPRYI